MSKFIDFVKEQTSRPGRPALTHSRNAVSLGVASQLQEVKVADVAVFSESAANKLACKIGEVAYSEKFLGEFSDAIGTPKANETEDEFVSRCKEKMSLLLKNKFK